MISSLNLSAAADLVRKAASEAQAAASSGSSVAVAAKATRLIKAATSRRAGTGLVAASRARRSAGKAVARRSSGAGWAGVASCAPRASGGAAGKSCESSSASSKTASGDDPLAFLHDSKLPIEEKLMRLLAHLNAQWEKDMQKKLDAFRGAGESSGTTKGSSASSGTSKAAGSGKGESLLGKAVEAAKAFLPGVGFALGALENPAVREVATRIGGPVLAAAATALGFPEAAPALLKYAPSVIDAAAGVASALDGIGSSAGKQTGPGAGASSGSTGSSPADKQGGGTTMSASEQQIALMEIQQLREKQKEMFAIVSNTLKSGHDLRMGVISNLR